MIHSTHLSYTILLVLITITALPASGIEEIKKLTINNNGYGKYSFEYETTSGTYRREEGGIAQSHGADFLAVRGEYGYIDTAGRLYSLRYVADVNGYRPESKDYSVRYNDRRII